jgi:hypothetical protein
VPITLTSLYDRSGNSYGAGVKGFTGSTAGTGTVTDPNGNQLTVSSGNYHDTLWTTGNPATLAVSGSGTPSSPTVYTYQSPNGAKTYTVNYTAKTVRTNFGCSGYTDYGPTAVNLVSSISMPDGTSYSFTYEPTYGYSGDVTGRLASVTLPTGGTISYTYGTGGTSLINCSDGGGNLMTRTTPDTGTYSWVYSRDITSGITSTTVGSPMGDSFAYFFSGTLETQRTVKDVTGTQVLQAITCYNGNTTSCGSASVTLPITQITATTTVGSRTVKRNTNINAYGLPTEVDEYDWGASTPMRKTITAYNYNTSCGVTNHPWRIVLVV